LAGKNKCLVLHEEKVMVKCPKCGKLTLEKHRGEYRCVTFGCDFRSKSNPGAIYQWIIRNNQQMNYTQFEITKTFHSIKAEVKDYYKLNGEGKMYFTVIEPYEPSKITDKEMIRHLNKYQEENNYHLLK
jgi:hypothetical protein